MEKNEVIAMYTHWKDAIEKAFIIIWSDYTWETIKYLNESCWVGNKSYKQYMELNKVCPLFY